MRLFLPHFQVSTEQNVSTPPTCISKVTHLILYSLAFCKKTGLGIETSYGEISPRSTTAFIIIILHSAMHVESISNNNKTNTSSNSKTDQNKNDKLKQKLK